VTIKNKELYVARGIVTFAKSLMRQHWVKRVQCLQYLQELLAEELKEAVYQETRMAP